MSRHILAIDQGTTGSTALVMSTDGRTLGRFNREFMQHFPQPGWVEHDAEEIWSSVVEAVTGALTSAGIRGTDIAAIGITNQRETTLVWDRATDRPIHRAIVWQDRRTADTCAKLRADGHEARVRERTGLVLDPYFSGTKIAWILDAVGGARERAGRGELAFGTIDSFLVNRLGGGAKASAPHVTDVTNASRTLLMGLRELAWDPSLCELFRVPESMLPKIVPSAGTLGHIRGLGVLPDGIPVSGIAGDQQAALFGQACFQSGDVKCTYGTGAFIVMNTGSEIVHSRSGLLSTVGWQIGKDVVYALEGSAFIAGAAVQWLRDGLGLIKTASEIEELARQVPSSEGVFFVPALSGLGAPHWDPGARGLITGLTRGTTRAHLARATLEAIAHQIDDLVRAMKADLGKPITRMRVDGGASANDVLMQYQSDVSDLVVERPTDLESTARGAAMLAGIGVGLFKSGQEASQMSKIKDKFLPQMDAAVRQDRLEGWNAAVSRARSASRS
ncbi:MAG TPA: glycerol kinase GlpK [Polyangiaceae bacterium]|jgi:glycerol kinase|nr:glycerol kinase GlpK [Polyangiaceae bacterium]